MANEICDNCDKTKELVDSLDLAKDLYGTEKHYAGINAFTKEAERICKKGGLICTLTYEIPKRIKNCDFIAVWGIYQIPSVSYMRCFTVSRKQGVDTAVKPIPPLSKDRDILGVIL